MNYKEIFEELKQADIAIDNVITKAELQHAEIEANKEREIKIYNDIKSSNYIMLRRELDLLKEKDPQAYIQSIWGHADYNDKGELVVLFK